MRATQKMEGLALLHFMMENKINFTGKDVLEVGPKHGLHSLYIDQRKPKSLTLCDLSEKRNMISRWMPLLRGRVELFLGIPFQHLPLRKSYDVLLCSGILYHNLDMMSIIIKCNEALVDGGILVLESATTRNDELKDLNVIEIHHPERYRGIPTIKFQPTKKAVISMLEIGGFEIMATDGPEERISVIAKKINQVDYGYGELK